MEKLLPVSVQDFTQMISGNFVYVDKTRYIYQMVRVPQAYYFLSRPRRFGKSLLVSTLKALFEGKKELFRGLWIENSDWEWKPHPVVEIDFSEIELQDPGSLKQNLLLTLDEIAAESGITIKQDILLFKFKKLITELSKKHQEKVVVLIDEYDKPIISHLGKGKERLEIAEGNRELLQNFFGVLKGARVAANLRFVLLTGISKFSKVSVFSELNNLKDLSMHSRYADMLGYTQDELENSLGAWIRDFADKKNTGVAELLGALKNRYDGYRFTEEETLVYNPYSILNALDDQSLKNYWFETATPAFWSISSRSKTTRSRLLRSCRFENQPFRLTNLKT